MDQFEWDEEKAAAKLLKHGIDFKDAVQIFKRPMLNTRSDRGVELRWQVIGDLGGYEISVVYTMRSERRRIISARVASKNEREAYRKVFPQE